MYLEAYCNFCPEMRLFIPSVNLQMVVWEENQTRIARFSRNHKKGTQRKTNSEPYAAVFRTTPWRIFSREFVHLGQQVKYLRNINIFGIEPHKQDSAQSGISPKGDVTETNGVLQNPA